MKPSELFEFHRFPQFLAHGRGAAKAWALIKMQGFAQALVGHPPLSMGHLGHAARLGDVDQCERKWPGFV